MAGFELVNPQLMRIGGIEIQLDGPGQYERYRDDDGVLYMAKQGPVLDQYAALARELRPKAILEIGVFRGGSTVFFHQLCAPERLVGVDFAAGVPPRLQAYIDAAGKGVEVYGGIDQADAGALDRIVRDEFPGGIDLVIDDASHWYGPTRAAFEAVFPHLNPGGVYAIEDWTWPQSPDLQAADAMWADQPSLTNLLFELVLAHGHPAPLFEEVVFGSALVLVRRGRHPLTPGAFRLEDYILTRGRPLPRL